MNNKEIIFEINKIISFLDMASQDFREYLNSGNKSYWSTYFCNIFKTGVYLFDLRNNSSIDTTSQIAIINNQITLYGDYTPTKRDNQERVLSLIFNIKKDLLKIIKSIPLESDCP